VLLLCCSFFQNNGLASLIWDYKVGLLVIGIPDPGMWSLRMGFHSGGCIVVLQFAVLLNPRLCSLFLGLCFGVAWCIVVPFSVPLSHTPRSLSHMHESNHRHVRSQPPTAHRCVPHPMLAEEFEPFCVTQSRSWYAC
jgi:hypothetical protein